MDKWNDYKLFHCLSYKPLTKYRICTNISYNFLLGDYSDRKSCENGLMYNITEKIHGNILLSYLYQSHWRLLVVDIDEKTIILLDSYAI